MKSKQCVNCGKTFKPLPQAPKQTYCSSLDCQKYRRRKWQESKLRTDPDYRENQASAQKAWANRNQDYWRKYRESERNREDQTHKGSRSAPNQHAINSIKMDLSSRQIPFADGLFRIRVIAHDQDVKMDSWIVEITRFDAASKPSIKNVKR